MKLRLFVIVLAAVVLFAPIPPSIVERYYSSSIFPALQGVATKASNRTAWVWFDLLIGIVGGGFLVLSGRDVWTRRLLPAIVRIAGRALTLAAVLYLAFVVLWGLNYRRQALRTKVPFDRQRVTDAAAVALAKETVGRLNTLHEAAHSEGWAGAHEVDPSLAASFARAVQTLQMRNPAVLGRPKRSLLDLYFRRAGVAGMTDPFFLETMVASDILPFERPHVVAHEWSHLAGVTDEGEANFVGWLACVRSDAPRAYSGWLFLHTELANVLPRDVAREIASTLGPGPRADLVAIRQRYEREVSPRLSTAGWELYDGYLKANRVEAGTRSYGEVIQLVLGTQLR